MSDEIEELIDEIESSTGQQVFQNLRALERIYQTFKYNFSEFEDTIGEIEQIEQSGSFDPERHQDAVLEMCIHFHNFVSSTKPVYEHTTTVRDQHFTEDMEKEYEHQFKQCDVSRNLGDFIRCLRNYTQHRLTPPIETKQSRSVLRRLSRSEPEVTVFISCDHLLESGDFNEQAREYLMCMGENVDIYSEAKGYYDEIVDLNSWMTDHYLQEYKEEVEERNELIKKLKKKIDN